MRDLDRAIERQFALEYFLQRIYGLAHGKVAGEYAAAKLAARAFDPRGQGNFFLARQQRDLGHLAEIHADRIVRQLGKICGRDGNRGRCGPNLRLDNRR
jgi:hypothetical protein